MTALPILPTAALSSVSGGITPLPSFALQMAGMNSKHALERGLQQWRQFGSGEIGKIECPYRSGGKDYIYMDIHKKKPYKNSCNHAKKKV
ncbi:hypothetical protein [Robinsoniella peoriensis]|uniref:hypothetical protein n=1 Tax=Robinsoniella peoriensis TaxID=180332 RepID=UPI0037534573